MEQISCYVKHQRYHVTQPLGQDEQNTKNVKLLNAGTKYCLEDI